MSVVVAGRAPVVTTGVTGEHRCVSWLLVVIKGEDKGCFESFFSRGAAVGISQFLIGGLFVIRGYRQRCLKSGHEGSVKAGSLGFSSFGKFKENGRSGWLRFLGWWRCLFEQG